MCLFYFHFFGILFFEFFYFLLFLAHSSLPLFFKRIYRVNQLGAIEKKKEKKEKQILFLYYETKTATNEFVAGIVCTRLCVFLITGFKRMKLSWSIIVVCLVDRNAFFPAWKHEKYFHRSSIKCVKTRLR